ncbi:polysaccharide deacetylase family protein [Crocosphaera sp. UHCC 0190]|uniref:polysaccharide deacetylase family protein n=1 Tax=Crocosphaera sp. UHCC 0190 TaxID=3110246 RepID=UPI002B202B86|nr:polysaccharide deacetylase family protein [Crocosphaera sp. UHCC 0190]MEA5508667.1 polysaccharide deacetylase family protein [Crocosphaera sp. UHCC 0190]
MFSSSSQWLHFKSALCCGSGVLMAVYGLITVQSVYGDNSTEYQTLETTEVKRSIKCQSPDVELASEASSLGLGVKNMINTGQTPSLALENCLNGVIPLENGATTQKIIVSPVTFPELWKIASTASNTVETPFPNIHPTARGAKVPIFMYHDILPRKEVFFDVTPEELEAHFKYIQEQGLTPISIDLLLDHLQKGVPLPDKPILLSFDDGYGGHYKYVYPLLKKYGYSAVFSVYVTKMDGKTARSSLTWEQLKEMAADPLVTIASHTVTHPRDLRELSDDELFKEIITSKETFEQKLGIPIKYFTYPEGKYDARVKQWTMAAGYKMALSMDDNQEIFAGQSPDLLSIGRFGQSQLTVIAQEAWGGYPGPKEDGGFDFTMEISKRDHTIDGINLMVINGGKPGTIHADSRYQVPEIMAGTEAIAAVDGAFFSLKYLDSNVMIGPVMSQGGEFVPGNASENPRLNGRPLVLITDKWVKFVPFDAEIHNTWKEVQGESHDGELITDAFVGAAWLVRDSQAQSYESFGNLFDFYVPRHRAFWGIHQSGQPMIGVSKDPVDSIQLGQILQKLGFRDAIMLDSGASTSLAFEGQSVVEYTPRPVPHVVVLFPALSALLETKK